MKKAVIPTHFYLGLILLLLSCESKKRVETIENAPNKKDHVVISADDSLGIIADPIQIPCYQLTNEKPIKALSLSKGYHGLVILKAEYNTASLEFTKYEVVMTKLLLDDSKKKYIPDENELAQLKPVLIKHINYIKLKKSNKTDCIAPVSFGFPISIK